MPYSLQDSSTVVQLKRRATMFGLRSFSYAGSKLWNDLPNYVKEMTDLSDFKFIYTLEMDQIILLIPVILVCFHKWD